jgi:hypothetical protein
LAAVAIPLALIMQKNDHNKKCKLHIGLRLPMVSKSNLAFFLDPRVVNLPDFFFNFKAQNDVLYINQRILTTVFRMSTSNTESSNNWNLQSNLSMPSSAGVKPHLSKLTNAEDQVQSVEETQQNKTLSGSHLNTRLNGCLSDF